MDLEVRWDAYSFGLVRTDTKRDKWLIWHPTIERVIERAGVLYPTANLSIEPMMDGEYWHPKMRTWRVFAKWSADRRPGARHA